MPRKKLSDNEILGHLCALEANSLGGQFGSGRSRGGVSQLQADREEALDYYHGRAVGTLAGPDGEDRSSVVSRDLLDTVEWVLPKLVKVFLSDDVVELTPTGMGDEQQAKQETLALNHIFKKENSGFMVLYNWFKDSLLQKVGYVYSEWNDATVIEVEDYTGLREEILAKMILDWQKEGKQVEVVNQEWDEAANTYSIKVRTTSKDGRFRVQGIPPEHVRVSPSPFSSMQDCPYIGFEVTKTRSELLLDGFSRKLVDSLPAAEENEEDRVRDTTWDEANFTPADPSTEEIKLYREWVRIDVDGDGISELREFLRTESEILMNEETDLIPIASITPIPMPHRHLGLSFHDLLRDLAQINTALWRQMIDNTVNANHPGHVVDENRVNIDDMLVDRPRRIIRTMGDTTGAVTPLQTENIIHRILPILEYTEKTSEKRTGGTGASLAMNADVLQNSTKGAFEGGMSAANERIETIARIFAETGVRDLFRILHALMVKHQDFRKDFHIAGQWMEVDPRSWKKRDKLTVSVGLGTNSKEQIRQNQQMLFQMAKDGLGLYATPENVYNLVEDISSEMGFPAAGRYFTNPGKIPKQEPKPDPYIEGEKMKAQVKMQDRQMTLAQQMELAKLENQIELLRMQSQQQQARQDDALELAKLELQYNKDLAKPGVGNDL